MSSTILVARGQNSDPAWPRRTPTPASPAASAALGLHGRYPPDAHDFLEKILTLRLIEPTVLRPFLQERAGRPEDLTRDRLCERLVQAGLLTNYQVDRVASGVTHGLVLGNYRVLDSIGQGGMGVVFLAEHRLMKRQVAVKVLPVDDGCDGGVRLRFYSEMRSQAELHHPNVVMAFDAGEVDPPQPDTPGLIYLVMEFVDGLDLEHHVLRHGRCGVAQACDFIRQAACGLQAAHDRHLIHRDLKPSNLLLAKNGQVKLVDFGLARQFCSRLTDPRSLLGSVEFMAPEQSFDPTGVGKEADIYGLGATLFWLLTGEPPYPFARSAGAVLRRLQHEPPRRLRDLRSDAPAGLDELIARMLDRNPARRPAAPVEIMHALTPHLSADARLKAGPVGPIAADAATHQRTRRALIVDDQATVRTFHRRVLEPMGFECVEASNGPDALKAAESAFDLILLDVQMPGMDGFEVCRNLRARAPHSRVKIIIVSGNGDMDELAKALPEGADDYIVKPFGIGQMVAKVEHALKLKLAQEREEWLAEQLRQANDQLRQSLEARAADVRQAQDALLFTVSKMAEAADGETPGHLRRMQRYTRVLAEQAAKLPPWAGQVDERFLIQLERCVPLHDIGKIGLPDEVLLKKTALTEAERRLLRTHPLIGDRILEALAHEHGDSLEFLGMARAIVRHHHERYDGDGYPDRLAGDGIPAAARLAAVADVYDALRRDRPHKQALPHAEAIQILTKMSLGQFDPTLIAALTVCEADFERIYRETAD
jgi:response regulator RpfG family c-di-GMP phosphodiesterase